MGEMTWDMPTVWNVSRLRVWLYVDNLVLDESNGAAAEATRERLAAWICAEAHTFGVEAHPADCQFIDEPAEMFRTKFTARWWPTTNEIELSCAGPHDGKVMAIPDVMQVLRLPIASRATLLLSPNDDRIDASIHYQTLRLAGWREAARRWVFREV